MHGERHPALLVASVAAFLNPFMTSAVNVALPSIGREFRLDAIVLSWISTSYLLGSVVFLVPFGRAADIYGRKRIFLAGVILYTAASFLCALAPSPLLLIALRIMQGITSAMIWSNGVAIVMSVFPPDQRGRALGITVASVYTGLAVGPFLGGVLTQHLGWRSIFLANVPFGLVAAWLTVTRLHGEWAGSPGERLDLAGSAIYGGSAVALMYGFSLLPHAAGAWLALAGVAGLVAFVRLEMRVDTPVLDVGLFRGNRAFALSNLAALLHYTATFGLPFMLSLYLQYVKGLSPGRAGAVLLAQPLMQTAFSPFAGRLSDRVEPRVVASAGLALTATGLALLSLAGEHTAMGFIVAALMIVGSGFGLFSSPNTNAVMSSVTSRSYGMAAGIVNTMRLGGQMLSMATVMLVLNVSIGKVQITPEYHGAFLVASRTAFLAFALYAAGGILASLSRGDVRERVPGLEPGT